MLHAAQVTGKAGGGERNVDATPDSAVQKAMTGGPSPTGARSDEPSSEQAATGVSSSAGKDERGRPLREFAHVLKGTNSLIVGAAALLAAVSLLGADVTGLLDGPGPPPTLEASFIEAKVEPNVLLEQYEESNRTTVNTGYVPMGDDGNRVEVSNVEATAATSEEEEARTREEAEAKETQAREEKSAKEALARAEAEGKEAQARGAKEAQEMKAKTEKEGREAQQQAAREQSDAQRRAAKEEAKLRGEGRSQQANAVEQQVSLGAEARRQQAQVSSEETKARVSEAATIAHEEVDPKATVPHQSATPILQQEGAAEVAAGTAVPTSEVDEVLSKAGVKLRSTCSRSCALRPTVDKAVADYSSNLNDAARQVAAAFNGAREGVDEGTRQPLGATVDYSIELVGYTGRLLIMEWSLCSTQTGRPLPRQWWRNVIVKEIKPTSNRVRSSGDFWAPVPPSRGNYYFRLRVFEGDSEAAHSVTGRFH